MNNRRGVSKKVYGWKIQLSPRGILAILVVGVVLCFGADSYIKSKKLEKLKNEVSESNMIDNGDGTSSTSLSKAIEDNVVKVKEVTENVGKIIVYEEAIEDLVDEEPIIFTHTKKLDWGGKATAKIKVATSFEYRSDPSKLKYKQLKSGAVHITVPRDSIECKSTVEDTEIVDDKLSGLGKLQQTFDFKDEDFKRQVLNSANKEARKQAKEAGDKRLLNVEVVEKIQKSTSKEYEKLFKRVGVQVYITVE